MVKDQVVTRDIVLNAGAERVWEALTHPGMTKNYMFNCEVNSEWKPGSAITWKGSHQGREILQRGEILEIVPGRLLRYSTFDPQTDADLPENYVYITYELNPLSDEQTQLSTSLENFNGDETRAEHAALLWESEVLPKLKGLIETTL
jgi:uncharacterized protein YndB with AHSA1/START domain